VRRLLAYAVRPIKLAAALVCGNSAKDRWLSQRGHDAENAGAGLADDGGVPAGRVAGLGKRRRVASTHHCAPSVPAGSPGEPSSGDPREHSAGAVLDAAAMGSPVVVAVSVVAVVVPEVSVVVPVVVAPGPAKEHAFQFSAGSRSSR